ncbi:MAG TPA: SIR2 family protein, partial [Burkholderiales bacterium]|nr:SIR2 family protein [Burkholderiales bacterium]
RMDSVTREAEWYVQHTCEQVVRLRAEALWTPILVAAKSINLTIATTNYDRAIEIGARNTEYPFVDGFEEQPHFEISDWKGIVPDAQFKILKLHGSTDWYLSDNGDPVKLRHTIPVFGDFKLHSSSEPHRTLSAALVLPSREKRITQRPYPALLTAFHNDALRADIAVFLGTSLRDPHLEDVFRQCARRIPTVFVSRTLPPPVEANAIWIRQTASYFLMSTLPWAIESESEAEKRLRISAEKKVTDSVIDPVVSACDEMRLPEERCKSIDVLLKNDVRLRTAILEKLIMDSNPPVRMFSLGLIPNSRESKRLSEIALQKAIDTNDVEMRRECELLENFLKDARPLDTRTK